jgi:hypothetical protein
MPILAENEELQPPQTVKMPLPLVEEVPGEGKAFLFYIEGKINLKQKSVAGLTDTAPVIKDDILVTSSYEVKILTPSTSSRVVEMINYIRKQQMFTF